MKNDNLGGINDKFAIVFSNNAIKTYLIKPFEEYLYFKKKISNPEQFYKYVYTKNGLILQSYNIDIKIIGQTG